LNLPKTSIKKKYIDRKIDIIINNAGLANTLFEKTKDNIEVTLQSNLLSHILFTVLLLKNMNKEGRIINVSSRGHSRIELNLDNLENDMNFDILSTNYNTFLEYCKSKLGQIYFTKSLSQYCIDNKIEVKNFCLHPGSVFTNIWGSNRGVLFLFLYYITYPIIWYFMKSAWMGAQTTLQLCYDDYNKLIDGSYYNHCKFEIPSEQSRNKVINKRYILYCLNLIEMNCKDKDLIKSIDYFSYLKHKKID